MTDLNQGDHQAVDFIAPLQQEGTKAVLRAWLKQAGESVSKDEPVVELETDKVVVEIGAPCNGILEVVLAEGTDAEPGAVLGRIKRPDNQPVIGATCTTPVEEATKSEAKIGLDMRLSPAVRRLVAEHDLDPGSLQGTGRGGRLTRENVIDAISSREQSPTTAVQRPATVTTNGAKESPASATQLPMEPKELPDLSSSNGPKVASHVPHSTMRRRIAEHMQYSVSVAPHVTAVFEADFSAIIAHRKQHKVSFAQQGINLTFTAYFIAAAVEAMRSAPEVNSRWHADYLEVFKDINIGVGAALGDKGLIVPVIHQAQDLSLQGIASRLQERTEAARTGKLRPADVQGGTFTISNHGVSGSLFASPIIINQPQSAILGIGALEKRVVVREVEGVESYQSRPLAYVSLTIDHRVLDGSQTNAWLSRFVEVLQSWPLHG
jgi:2-oxoglutarate dehydrogenase E2 component (dihydrolipoamide succinyltransferase)